MSLNSNRSIVWWKDLERWVIQGRLQSVRQLPRGWSVACVGEVVRQIRERVRVEPQKQYKMVGVKWYGEGAFHRETVGGDALSATYVTPVLPNCFIYNRLFAWKGSFAVVTEEHKDCFVSNEFPQFIVDESRVLPQYLYLFFMCDITIQAVNAVSVGSAAVSRNRFREEEFLSFEIPLPPEGVQRSMVRQWEDARKELIASRQSVERLKAELHDRLFKELALRRPGQIGHVKSFSVWWRDFLRWSVSYNEMARAVADLSHGSYSLVNLGSVLQLMQYGTSEKANTKREGTPVLRIGNIKHGAVDFTKLKYVRLGVKTQNALLLKDGDILLIRTSGSRDLVGTCAVFHGKQDCVFASYLIRLRTRPDKADPDFVSWFLNSELGRVQINATSRQIMQNNINSGEIAGLRMPLPPLTVQRALVQQVEATRLLIEQQENWARRLGASTKRKLEEMISGVRPAG